MKDLVVAVANSLSCPCFSCTINSSLSFSRTMYLWQRLHRFSTVPYQIRQLMLSTNSATPNYRFNHMFLMVSHNLGIKLLYFVFEHVNTSMLFILIQVLSRSFHLMIYYYIPPSIQMEPNHSCSLVISSKSSTLTIQSVSEHEYAYFQGIHFNEVSPQASIINYFVFCNVQYCSWIGMWTIFLIMICCQ